MYRTAVAGLRIMLFFMKIYATEHSCESLTTTKQVVDLTITCCLKNITTRCPLKFELIFCNNETITEDAASPPTNVSSACVNIKKRHTRVRHTLSNIAVNAIGCNASIVHVTVREENIHYFFSCEKGRKCKPPTVNLRKNTGTCVIKQFFGPFCTKKCKCEKTETCNRTGKCEPQPCLPGWSGTGCNISILETSATTVKRRTTSTKHGISETLATTVKRRKPTFSTTSTKHGLKPDPFISAGKSNKTGLIAGILSAGVLIICIVVGVYLVKKLKVHNPKKVSDGTDSLICTGSLFVDLTGDTEECAKSRRKRKKKSKNKSKTRKKKEKKKTSRSSSSTTDAVSTSVGCSVKTDGKNSIKRNLSFNEKVEMKHYIKK